MLIFFRPPANVSGQQPAPQLPGMGLSDHVGKANSVCAHIDDLVMALTELYEDNAKWKSK